ncbi:MAG: amino acid ABC transporter permease [Deltaproteobacteria bacterium]|nr:amino acid ABC transporter permease [Deltaproteobacteria bacterium]MBW1962432.1 amino acid ABC transporter permease [Deltaproteobacteria bacterium]MBW2153391.1 amino acid ABC transporter permease [Deltaproteobacteria bacterium]
MVQTLPHRIAPEKSMSVLRWVRSNLFSNVFNTVLTLFAIWAIWVTIPGFVRWVFLDSVWYTDDPGACRNAAGACWAVVAEKHRVMLFGTFPYEEHWRGVLAIGIIIGMSILSAFQRFWSYKLFYAWLAAFASVLVLMLGGVFGLTPTGTHQWGGLPLTLMLFVGTIVGGLPLSVLLALGRRSHLPAVKAVCIAIIEVTRGVPLITVLFMASMMFPLFMPEGVNFNKVLRAQIAMMIFFAAYGAEIVRGGLQAIPAGQYEAAEALGLTYWQKTRKIILPQALRIVIPALMNDIIRAFKNTTFISIIGLFDVLGATATSLEDPLWVRYAIEAYIFIFILYFCFCFTMSKYSQWVERYLNAGRSYT